MTTTERRHLSPGLKIALEMGPLVLFFLINTRYGIFTATAWFMAAMVVSLAVMWLLARRVAVMPIVSCVILLVFGTLTLLLEDATFIKLKPTIVNVLFGSALLLGLALGKNLLDIVFDGVFRLTPEGWRVLTLRWAGFFFALAILNEILWRGFSTETWMAFKVWGVMPLTMLFAIAQVPLLTRHALPDEPEASRG
jgi:intracellular septation protein